MRAAKPEREQIRIFSMVFVLRRRFLIGVAVVLASLGLAGWGAMHLAARALKAQVEVLLGPEASIGQIQLAGSAVEIRQLRVPAPKGWPCRDALRAERILVEPDYRAAFSGQWRVKRVLAEQPYLSVLRTRQGRMRLLPSLLERKDKPEPETSSGAKTQALISAVELQEGTIDFFDASLRGAPHALHFGAIAAKLGPLSFPQQQGATSLDIQGAVRSPRRDGKLSIRGWIALASSDSEISLHLQDVDLRLFEPYLLKSAETGVRGGRLSLELQSRIRNRRLRAPGTLTLSRLELSDSSFMGMPRQWVLAALKDRMDEIRVRFTLEGRLDDPKFSLNESIAMKLAASLSKLFGP
jgi:hypothetical protein